MSPIKTILFSFFTALLFFSCNKTYQRASEFYCSVENTQNSVLVDDNNTKIHFNGFEQICDSVSFSGNNSLFTDKNNPFAFTTELKISTEGTYELSFWQKGGGDSVYAVVQYDTLFYKNSSTVVDSSNSDWKKISLTFSLSKELKNKALKFYVWNTGTEVSFVDDFSLKNVDIKEFGKSDTIFWMYIDDLPMRNLQFQRKKAFANGVLTTNDQSWVKAMLLWGNENYKVKVRLKGDWLDHISGEKWSFRIKIKSNKAFKGMRVFSVQNPNTRHFIDQWFLYTLFRSEDLLAPRYGFVTAQRNNKFLGIYAYEEHFRKQLVESLSRREGPILKHSEEAFWDLIIENNKTDKWFAYPLFEASKILPFSQSKTMKNSVLNAEFNIAKNLVYQHKYGLAKISDLFDVDKAAKFFALTNVMQGYHGFRWHNQRYYYNPVTSKLEFVTYDNYVGGGIFKLTNRIIFGDFFQQNIPKKPESILNYYLFSDTIFVKNYVKYLQKYSEKSFWDSVFTIYDENILYYENILQKEFEGYSFNKEIYYSQADSIKKHLPDYITKINSNYYSKIDLPFRKNSFYKDSAISDFISDYVKIYLQESSNNTSTYKIISYYPADLQVNAYLMGNKKYFLEKTVIPAYFTGKNEIIIKISNKVADFMFVSDGKINSKIEILPWSEPIAWSPRQELEQDNKFPNEPFYKVHDKKVIFSGKQTINKIILIPKGFQVIFTAGTEIDFIKGGGFLSYSNVQMLGTAQNPIKIFSSDNSARGFTVLQAPKVEFNFTTFDGLNTFDYKGWTLTGAVSIFESNVKFSYCKFINNVCEDDLNLIKCKLFVTNCKFENTFSDAFDSDFSEGTVNNCVFEDLGNDAIDFSTSKIIVQNCSIKNANDKGISGGEASHLIVKNSVIDGSKIAIASKDKSVLELSDIQINNSTYGLVLYQKKPEYGNGKIIAENIKAENVIQFSLIEKGSVLILDGLKIEGKYKDVAKKFY